ncbi:MAG TPA: GGDEF domain-containing protein, partial [Polyangia bacterium]
MARPPTKRDDTTPDLDRIRSKTVVTSINRITEHPPTKEACLVVIYGPELGRKYSLESPAMTLGRSNKCDIQIDQESVSRAHSKIVNAGRSVRIRDLGSTNGTYVNDELVEERTLVDGDFIKIGRTIFKFLSGGNIERAYHEEIYRLTTVDGLTQIFNKRYFSEALTREIARATRYRRELSLVMFDLDHFKEVNDTLGHHIGDQVIQATANRLSTALGASAMVSRLGGDEFAVLVPGVDPNAVLTVAHVALTALAAPLTADGVRIDVGASIGVAVAPE